jgi:diguanylate cyclase (GGDEF)-like protein/PAS domain S-box-containing protein
MTKKQQALNGNIRTVRPARSNRGPVVKPASKIVAHGELDDSRIANSIFNNALEGMIITDHELAIQKINPAFTAITGYELSEVCGETPRILRSERHSNWFYRDMWQTIKKEGRWSGRVWDRRKNGEIYPTRLTISSMHDEAGGTIGYVGIFSNIPRDTSDIVDQTNYDALTGLPNRLLFNDRLGFMLAHAKRNKQILSVLLLDINRFKSANDSLGYTAGDLLLQTVAVRLRETLRKVDAVFRLGNDEFAIVLEEISHVEDAAKVAKKILGIFDKPFEVANYDHEFFLSGSIGISLYPHDASDVERLVRNAESAMYRAKEQGENSYEHYSPDMNAKTFKRLTLEYRMHRALDQGEFVVYYQPQIEVQTRRIRGAEALVRWNHPEIGLVPPLDFIPIAEETGLIVPLGQYVLETACAQVRQWQDKGYGIEKIAVNLSARQFQEKNLAQSVRGVLQKTAISPSCLELEITESIGMKNAERTIKTLERLKNMGVCMAIDDFGTGYSSLSYLRKFPINTLKIDRSFVMDVTKDPEDEAIVALIIAMAHALGIRVIAEGVEDEEQLNYLLDQGCEGVQGYFFSPPVPSAGFEKLVVEQDKQK